MVLIVDIRVVAVWDSENDLHGADNCRTRQFACEFVASSQSLLKLLIYSLREQICHIKAKDSPVDSKMVGNDFVAVCSLRLEVECQCVFLALPSRNFDSIYLIWYSLHVLRAGISVPSQRDASPWHRRVRSKTCINNTFSVAYGQ